MPRGGHGQLSYDANSTTPVVVAADFFIAALRLVLTFSMDVSPVNPATLAGSFIVSANTGTAWFRFDTHNGDAYLQTFSNRVTVPMHGPNGGPSSTGYNHAIQTTLGIPNLQSIPGHVAVPPFNVPCSVHP